MTVNVDHV